MPETYYTAITRHHLRYYAKNPDGPKRDVETWHTVHTALMSLSDSDRDMVLRLHSAGEILSEAIQRVCTEDGCNPERLWKLTRRVEKLVAKEFGWIRS